MEGEQNLCKEIVSKQCIAMTLEIFRGKDFAQQHTTTVGLLGCDVIQMSEENSTGLAESQKRGCSTVECKTDYDSRGPCKEEMKLFKVYLPIFRLNPLLFIHYS